MMMLMMMIAGAPHAAGLFLKARGGQDLRDEGGLPWVLMVVCAWASCTATWVACGSWHAAVRPWLGRLASRQIVGTAGGGGEF